MAYRVLIIGCGAIAGGYDADRSTDDWPLSHAGAIARDDRFELAACVDPDDTALEAFSKRWRVPKAAPSLEALTASPGDFDVIVITSPTEHHGAHLDAALSFEPRFVFCEKPLAKDLAEAERIAAEYEAAGIPLGVNYTRRFPSDTALLADEQWTRNHGELISAAGTYTKGVVHNGSHLVDFIQFAVGPLKLVSVGPARFDHWDDDPTVSAILEAPNGAPVHLIAGDARKISDFELTLTYEGGQSVTKEGGRYSEWRPVVDSDTYAGYRVLGRAEERDTLIDQAMVNAYASIGHVLADIGNFPSTAVTALSAQRLCEEIRRKALENLEKDPE